MTKATLEKSLYKRTNGCPWVSTNALRVWYGRGYDSFKEFVNGLDTRVHSNRIEYFIPDVAQKLYLTEIAKGEKVNEES